jgi:cyclic pyranopterin phosphate synthase
VDFATFGRDRGVVVRFIEFMPLDADGSWSADMVVSGTEIIEAIGAVYPLEPVTRGHEPAERFRYRDGRGEIGVIASVTEPFCASCDRVRLTADGQLRSCLFSVDETDLRAIMRSGGTDDDLATAIRGTVAAKGPGHAINQIHFIRPKRSMSQIGG